MKYFLDSGKIDEIRYAYENYKIDGVTTNPRHIKESGKPFLTVINELAEEFKGKDFPISVEINPHLTHAEEMIAHAKELSQIAENFVIKVPCNEQGMATNWPNTRQWEPISQQQVYRSIKKALNIRLRTKV